MIRKQLAVVVILLFIGVAFTPSINANVVKDDFVEFDVEFCGLGKKHTVKLTQQEADEFELLIDEIRTKLDKIESREETEVIFKEAVVELDKFGLLGGLSVRQAQRLVTGVNQNPRFMSFLDKLINRNLGTLDYDVFNFDALIVGQTDNTNFISTSLKIAWSIYSNVPHNLQRIYYSVVIAPLLALCHVKPSFFVSDILIDNGTGWIWTDGLDGEKSWNGTFIGIVSPFTPNEAISKFTGLKILIDSDSSENYYFGYARIINIRIVE